MKIQIRRPDMVAALGSCRKVLSCSHLEKGSAKHLGSTICIAILLGIVWQWGGTQVHASDLFDSSNGGGHWCIVPDNGSSSITGRIVSSSGAPVANATVFIHASLDRIVYCRQKTGADGTFQFMQLPAATYQMKVFKWRSYWYHSPNIDPIEVAEGETVDMGDIIIDAAPSIVPILGTVVDSDGALVTDIDARAYLRESPDELSASGIDNAGNDGDGRRGRDGRGYGRRQHGYGTAVDEGTFQIDAWAGKYEVNLKIKPGGPYYIPSDQQILVDTTDGISKTVAITVARYSAVISGTLFLPGPDGTLVPPGEPATNLRGRVRAVSSDDDKGVVATIDPDTAQYQLYLNPGTWTLYYAIHTHDYLPFNAEPVSVTVGADENVTQNFTLSALDATVQGTVTDADGDPIRWAYVTDRPVDRAGDRAAKLKARVRNGEYELSVASDHVYAIKAHAWRFHGAIQPAAVTVTPTANSSVTVDLQFQDPDASISGVVTLEDGSPAPYARVAAQSTNGQSIKTRANAEGAYHLGAVSGIWNVDAYWYSHMDKVFHRSADGLQVDLTTTSTATLDITLFSDANPMPEAAQSEFVASSGWSAELSDGMRVDVPRNALSGATDISISITPVADELPSTSDGLPISYGYEIRAHYSQSGQAIEGDFLSDVVLTFSYSDEDLDRAGVSEEAVAPAYYDADEDNWIIISSFTLDPANNEITVQTDHFSLWALIAVTPATIEQPNESLLTTEFFLPLIVQ